MQGDSTMPLMTLFCRTVMSATLIMPSEFTSPEPLGLHPSVRMAPVQISLTPGQQSPAIAHTTESQPQPLDVYPPQSVAVHAGGDAGHSDTSASAGAVMYLSQLAGAVAVLHEPSVSRSVAASSFATSSL